DGWRLPGMAVRPPRPRHRCRAAVDGDDRDPRRTADRHRGDPDGRCRHPEDGGLRPGRARGHHLLRRRRPEVVRRGQRRAAGREDPRLCHRAAAGARRGRRPRRPACRDAGPGILEPLDARRLRMDLRRDARAELHRVARAAAEGLRRARRSHRPHRRRPERRRAPPLRADADPARHGGARAAPGSADRRRPPSRPAVARAGAALSLHVRPAVLGRRAGAGGGLLGGGERRRRRAVHAGDVALAGSLQAVRESCRQRSPGAARGAGRVGRRRACRARRRLSLQDRRRRAQHLLYAREREPLRPDRRRPLPAASACARGARRDCGWRRGRRRRAAVERGEADRRVHAGDVRAGGGGRRVRAGRAGGRAGGGVAHGPCWRNEITVRGASLFDLSGKTALVIGAGSGIGEAIAIGCARHGARVVCLDVNEDAARRVASQAAAEGAAAEARPLDIRDVTAVDAAFDEADRAGGADIAICTPSINVRKPILKYSDEELDRVFAVNIKGNFHVLRAAGRVMTARGRGSIILFSSVRSQVVEPGQGAYAATKAGIVQLARAAAAEFGPSGVRVNAIAPGVIETPLTAPIKANADWYNAYAAKSVFNRWGRPEELVGAAVFLASDAASYVTGSVIFVDGGWLAADGRFTPPGM